MRFGVALALLAAALACGGAPGGLFRQYEYEEETYLALDGSATIYVNASVQALNALRGTSFDPDPRSRFDSSAVREYFTSPATRVTRVSRPSRRNNRRYLHVRLDVDDVRRLHEAPPFAWSSYQLREEGGLAVFRQTVGRSAGPPPPDAGWDGSEVVAFRIHIPSEVVYHNAGAGNLRRGNILVWEQPLAARLRGDELVLDARMETQSILYSTLWLFGATIAAVALTFALVIWWLVRRPKQEEGPNQKGR